MWKRLLLTLVLGFGSSACLWSKELDSYLSVQAKDATLHACFLASLDKGWAVGDRGLILATSDGGKSWNPQESGVDHALHAIHMQDEKFGCIVGGTIQEFSQRSLGICLTTRDGGQTWTQNSSIEFPRLTGIQSIAPNHLIAWGDYSPHLRTAIFESIDGGKNWNATNVPIGHIQDCAWAGRNIAVMVDRLGRVYRADANGRLEVIKIGGDPSRPLRCVAMSELGFFVGGSGGELWQSPDGFEWKRLVLPGRDADHRWITIEDVHVQGADIWLCGRPGHVVWHSPDGGKSWQIQSLPKNPILHAIHGWKNERLLAVGPFARAVGSRNSGKGWWVEHSSGERVGLLNLSSNVEEIAWDMLAMASWQHGRHAAVHVSHDGKLESRVDLKPDVTAQLASARNRMVLGAIEVCPQFPVRAIDKASPKQSPGYQIPAGSSNLDGVTLSMAYAIRNWCPDVIVIGKTPTGESLASAHARSAQHAVRLAMDESFLLFTPESQIPNHSWRASKVFSHVDSVKSGLSFTSQQILYHPGLLLRDILRPLWSLGIDPDEDFLRKERSYSLVYCPIVSESARREIFGGIGNDPKTMRASPPKAVIRLSTLQKRIQSEALLDQLLTIEGPTDQRDIRWEQNLDRLLQAFESEQKDFLLLSASERCAENGFWNRREALLERLTRMEFKNGACIEAFRRLSLQASSEEIRLWIDRLSQSSSAQRIQVENAAVAVATITPSSPFPSSSSEVKTASFDGKGTRSAISVTSNGIAPASDQRFAPASHEGRTRPLDRVLQRAIGNISPHQPSVFLDPTVRLSCLALRNQDSKSDGMRSVFQDLSEMAMIAGWCQVGQQELMIYDKRLPEDAAYSRKTHIPPILDGSLQDRCWQSARPVLLTDPWQDHSLPTTKLYTAHDRDYFYIAIQCPKGSVHSEANPTPERGPRAYDSMRADRDHLWIRLDVDRDYSSWYAFGIDDLGQVSDRLGPWKSWNPSWHVFHHATDLEWIAEIAIPFEELIDQPVLPGDCWAVAVHRSTPRHGHQNNGRVASDEFQPQGMRLLTFQE